MTIPNRLFCDTSFFYASLDRSDANHDRAQQIARQAAAVPASLYATWDVIGETVTLLRYRRGFQAALLFLTEVKPNLRIVAYGDRVRGEAEDVFRRYGGDHRLSFCDAISFVLVTTLLRNMACLAFDADFQELGLTVVS